MALRYRRPVHKLAADEERALEGAFRALAESPDNRSNYSFWASIHTHCCPHATAVFLPWHRAYIFQFEEALRAARGMHVTLPYWDWIAEPRVPPLVERLLPVAPRFPDEHRVAHGLRLPTHLEQDWVLAQEAYLFLGAACADQNPGELENLHGLPHRWTGSYMAEPNTAAFDPIFWLHHANVDRLWALWQRDHWGEHPPCPQRTLDGVPGGWVASDVEYVTSPRLGYEYVNRVVPMHTNYQLVADRTVSLQVAAADCGRVRLLLAGIRAAGRGPAPAEIEVLVNGGAGRARISLFGLAAGCDQKPPPIVPVPGCDRHHRHHGDGLVADIDLTSVAGRSSVERLDLRLVGHAQAAPLDIDQVLLICE